MTDLTHDIMTAPEVGEYLRVSERTVYDWAHKGILPGARIGASWRFRRAEIEDWFNRKFSAHGTAATAVSLADVLSPERVIFLQSSTKREALIELVQALAGAPEIHDLTGFREGILRRETLMSTGIGLGIGLPHVRLSSIDNPVMAVGKCVQPIRDYEALDGNPVQVIFMIGAGRDQHAQHVMLLSAISQRMKNHEFRELLLATSSPDEFYQVVIREPA